MSSLENALRILACFDQKRQTVRVAELARNLSLPKSSVSRLLRVMAEFRMLERGQSELAYQVGPRMTELAELRSATHPLADLADAAVTGLVAEFGFTGYVSILSGADIVLLRVRQGSYPLRHVREIGTRLPATRTAMGKALLSCCRDEELFVTIPHCLQPETEIGATLLADISAARRDGFFKAQSQLTPGITTIAAGVSDRGPSKPIAIAIAFPDIAVSSALEMEICRRVAAKAGALAATFACQGRGDGKEVDQAFAGPIVRDQATSEVRKSGRTTT
jgi:DNA-binding IclR family transcriptional regulator